MNADELLKKIIESGADENGIRDRFGSNVELYESCFRDFLEEPNFVTLRDAVHTRSYDLAFSAAHALKGLSGNLGLSDLYSSVRMLTESLRSGKYENVDEEYAELERQHEKLMLLVSEQSPCISEVSAPPAAADGASDSFASLKKKNNRLTLIMSSAALVVIFAIGLLFYRINIIHSENVIQESSQHLLETASQIKLYIEDHISLDWRIAQSVGDSILDSAYVDDDPAIFNMLARKQDVWGASDLMLYTENGHCIYADGTSEMNDIASETIYNARKHGKYMSVIDSQLIYTVPLDTELTYAGSRIAAVSVVRDMSTFLDHMNFNSFDGAAWMYLTDQNGILISSLTTPHTINAFNIQTVVRDMEITPLDENSSPEDFLADPYDAAFLLSDGSEKSYGVSAPIFTASQSLHLFYFVPEPAVNDTMNGFSRQLIIFSMAIIFVFALCAFLVFFFIYNSRKRLFDQAILMRERMFDLLVKNSKTAFGLLVVDQEKPAYISDNACELVGDKYWKIEKTASGYRILNDHNTETDSIRSVNEALCRWDGRSVFRSRYLRNGQSVSAPYFEFELYPVGEDGKDIVWIAQDVTEAHAREEATRDAMEMATRSNEAKTRFLSNMSHDIRTPMNAIMNMSNFALENVDQPRKLATYLRVIHDSAEHLLQLINDVLDVSRIESGRVVVEYDTFDIKAAIQRQADMIRPLCSAKRQTFMTDFSGIKETLVCGDSLKLSQIIMNLLSNATKFTPERGAVRFIAKDIPSLRNDMLTVCFTIEDNGIGISDTDKKHIFEPFGRASDKAVSKIEGTGLGLSICKNYIEAMGGTIRCDSEHGEGTIFTVELFFQKADISVYNDKSVSTLTDASFLGLYALVAEDNVTNQLIAKELLERMGFILDFADDGSEAVSKFRSSRPGTYDVIFMDIQMPVINGYDATLQIRASTHPQAKTIPIIAMTANAFAEDIEKARMVGMDAYVGKPIVSFNLAEQTKKAIQNKRRCQA